MSSIQKRFRRHLQKKRGDGKPEIETTKVDDAGNATVLHPTKGFRRVSAKRSKFYR